MSSEKKLTNITVCLGSSCFSRGNRDNVHLIKKMIAQNHLEDFVEIAGTHCMGKCQCGPHLKVDENEHDNVDANKLKEIFKKWKS